jgi:hypothetical protein
MVFRSKIDLWLVAVLAAAMALPFLEAMEALRSGSDSLPHLLIFVLLGGFFLSLLLSTKYTVSGDTLLVQSGLFRWRIVRSEITKIVPSRSIISSPALSLDRLRVDYANGRKSVLISPKDKEGFLKAIAVTSQRPNPSLNRSA